MPLVTNITTAWSAPVTLATAEIWQARSRLFFSTEAAPGAQDGIEMQPGDTVQFAASEAVTLRSPEYGAQLVRMPVK